MESKYYTPSIDEFHVGFEIQMQNIENAQWGNYTLTKDDFTFVESDYSTTLIDLLNNIENVRVKYLDKEDIENLGWIATETMGFYNFSINDRFYLSTYNDPIQRVEIGDNENEFSFAGTIKNKSELRKLMQQLNII